MHSIYPCHRGYRSQVALGTKVPKCLRIREDIPPLALAPRLKYRGLFASRSLMQFRLLALGSCFVVMCIGLVGCTGSTGLTVQNRVLPPSITTQPANQTVTAGQKANLA